MTVKDYWATIDKCEKGQRFIRDKFGGMVEHAKKTNCCLTHYGTKENPVPYDKCRTRGYTYTGGKRRVHKLFIKHVLQYVAHGRTGPLKNTCGNPQCISPFHNEIEGTRTPLTSFLGPSDV